MNAWEGETDKEKTWRCLSRVSREEAMRNVLARIPAGLIEAQRVRYDPDEATVTRIRELIRVRDDVVKWGKNDHYKLKYLEEIQKEMVKLRKSMTFTTSKLSQEELDDVAEQLSWDNGYRLHELTDGCRMFEAALELHFRKYT